LRRNDSLLSCIQLSLSRLKHILFLVKICARDVSAIKEDLTPIKFYLGEMNV